eukprot:scaffold83623_cov30-Cyclotella_meneghiniana.AAC.1
MRIVSILAVTEQGGQGARRGRVRGRECGPGAPIPKNPHSPHPTSPAFTSHHPTPSINHQS